MLRILFKGYRYTKIFHHQYQPVRYKNYLIENARTASTIDSILDRIPSDSAVKMTKEEIQNTCRDLFKVKRRNWLVEHPNIQEEHPKFQYLCNEIVLALPEYNVQDNIEILKVLCAFQPIPSETLNALMRDIRDQITSLPLNNIVFLDFILRKFDSSDFKLNESVQVLRLTIPMLFQIHVSKCENITSSHLRFISDNFDSISKATTENVIAALHSRNRNLSVDEAMTIIASYCNIGPVTSKCESLIKNSFKVLCKSKSFGKSESIKRETKYISYLLCCHIIKAFRKYPILYNKKFIELRITNVIKGKTKLSKLLTIQNGLNQMRHINLKLVAYILDCVEETDENLTTANVNVILNALSLVKYKPRCLRESFWSKIWASDLFHTEAENVDWIDVTLNLIALNKFDRQLIEKVLSDEYVRETFDDADPSPETTNRQLSLIRIFQSITLAQDLDSIDVPQFKASINSNRYIENAIEENLNSSLVCPLQSFLETEIGCDKVLTLVKSKYGHGIQHILKLDKDSRNFLAFNEALLTNRDAKFIRLEEIECGPNEILVAVCAESQDAFSVNTLDPVGLAHLFCLHLRKMNILPILIHNEKKDNERKLVLYSRVTRRHF